MKEYAIIVAGGSGKRMCSDTPKQFLEIGGLPILCHTIEAFYDYSNDISIIVVLPADKIEHWKSVCGEYGFSIPHLIVGGGNTRFQSVKNGLTEIKEPNSLVAIHDGVRPFVSREVISESFKTAEKYGSGIVAAKPKESIRQISGNTTISRNRSDFFSIQTPQTFRTNEILEAYEGEEKDIFTDDASVAEHFGIEIILVTGSDENIKITTQTDFIFAEALLEKRNKKK